MEVSISYISSDRFFGKKFRLNYDEIELLKEHVSCELSSKLKSNEIEIWFVDKPEDYIEIVKNEPQFIELHIGRDLDADFKPSSGISNEEYKKTLRQSINVVIDLLSRLENYEK